MQGIYDFLIRRKTRLYSAERELSRELESALASLLGKFFDRRLNKGESLIESKCVKMCDAKDDGRQEKKISNGSITCMKRRAREMFVQE